MSCAEILPHCDISVRVFVRSTRVSRPSLWDNNRIVREGLLFDFDPLRCVVGA